MNSVSQKFIEIKRITDKLELRLDVDGKTQIYINENGEWKHFGACMFLLLDIPVKETETSIKQTEGQELNSVDEFSERYGRDMEGSRREKVMKEYELTPRDIFWGHCSNMEAWVENNYNPHVLHTSLSIRLIASLGVTDKSVLVKAVEVIDKDWNRLGEEVQKAWLSKDPELIKNARQRRVLFRNKYIMISEMMINHDQFTTEELTSSSFIGINWLIREIIAFRLNRNILKRERYQKKAKSLSNEIENLEFVRYNREINPDIRHRTYSDDKDKDKKIKRQLCYYERKAGFNKFRKMIRRPALDLEHRHLYRDIRNIEDYTRYSSPVDYPSLLFSKGKFQKAGDIYFYHFMDKYTIIRDEDGIFMVYTRI